MSDTSEITKECLTHYDNQHLQVRKDFLALCEFDRSEYGKKDVPNQECMAKILRVLESLTDQAKGDWYLRALKAKDKGLNIPREPKEYPQELTWGVISLLLYNTYAENTIRFSMKALIKKGYVTMIQETNNVIPIYFLNLTIIQADLKKQAEALLDRGTNSNPTFKRLRGANSNPKPSISNPNGANSNPQGCELEPTIDNSKITEIKRDEERVATATPASPDVSGSQWLSEETEQKKEEQKPRQLSTPNVDKQKGKGDKSSKLPKQDNDALPPDVQAVIDAYQQLFKEPIPISDAILKAAKQLAPCHPSAEDLKAVRVFCWSNNPEWYGKNGKTHGRVTLKDIASNWEGWKSSQQAQSPRQQRTDAMSRAVSAQLDSLRPMPTREELRKEAF